MSETPVEGINILTQRNEFLKIEGRDEAETLFDSDPNPDSFDPVRAEAIRIVDSLGLTYADEGEYLARVATVEAWLRTPPDRPEPAPEPGAGTAPGVPDPTDL